MPGGSAGPSDKMSSTVFGVYIYIHISIYIYIYIYIYLLHRIL